MREYELNCSWYYWYSSMFMHVHNVFRTASQSTITDHQGKKVTYPTLIFLLPLCSIRHTRVQTNFATVSPKISKAKDQKQLGFTFHLSELQGLATVLCHQQYPPRRTFHNKWLQSKRFVGWNLWWVLRLWWILKCSLLWRFVLSQGICGNWPIGSKSWDTGEN